MSAAAQPPPPRHRRHGAPDRAGLRHRRCSGVNSIRVAGRVGQPRSSRCCSRAPTSATAWSPSVSSEIRSAEQYLVRPGRAPPRRDDRGGRLGLRLPAAVPLARLAHHRRPLHRQQDRRQPGADRSRLRHGARADRPRPDRRGPAHGRAGPRARPTRCWATCGRWAWPRPRRSLARAAELRRQADQPAADAVGPVPRLACSSASVTVVLDRAARSTARSAS